METLIVTNQDQPVTHIEFNPSTALKTLDAREAELVLLAEESKSFTIKGADDKEGYKASRAQRIKLKNARIAVVDDAEALREGANKFAKTVIGRQKQLIAIISPEENRLESEEQKYDEWQEQIRIEEEKKESTRIQARIDTLAKFGHAIDVYDAKVMPEEDFQALLGQAEAEHIKMQEMLESKKIEDERVKREEEERIQKEREELERQKAELARKENELRESTDRAAQEQREREAAIKAEQDRKDAEIAAERKKLEEEKRALKQQLFDQRTVVLFNSLSLCLNGEYFTHAVFDLKVKASTVADLDEAAFNLFLEEGKASIDKQREEIERTKNLEAERQEALKML